MIVTPVPVLPYLAFTRRASEAFRVAVCLVYPIVLTFAILFAVVFIATWNELNALDPILSPKNVEAISPRLLII